MALCHFIDDSIGLNRQVCQIGLVDLTASVCRCVTRITLLPDLFLPRFFNLLGEFFSHLGCLALRGIEILIQVLATPPAELTRLKLTFLPDMGDILLLSTVCEPVFDPIGLSGFRFLPRFRAQMPFSGGRNLSLVETF